MSSPTNNNKNDDSNRMQFLLETETTELQTDTEDECQPYFLNLEELPPHQLQHLQEIGLVEGLDVCLLKENHTQYLTNALRAPLRSSFVSLDSSRPWIMYWCLQSLDLMENLPAHHVLVGCMDTLKACWTSSSSNDGGGFGGGPGQMAHGAPTYAAIMVLCILATCDNGVVSTAALEFLEEIRVPLYKWFLSLKLQHGGFSIHENGEWDVRATYTVISVATLLNTRTPELTEGVANFITSCQTYEGGFGGEPGSEAHGGYTYCAVAALELLNSLGECNLPALRTWLCLRQCRFEGGFNGRSNKLVDGCYSFWQGAALAIVSRYFGQDEQFVCDETMLQRYILLCAQDLNGGLRDKPSKPRDFYHSCYNLSGLSISQHYGSLEYGHAIKSKVRKTDACYNIRVERVEAIQKHFSSSVVIEQASEQE